jgi:NADP-dependent 3-hydroxy acid dehydrogenase YdfG
MPKQVVAITGCSSGLGFATVVKLVEQGYIVYAGMRNLAAQHELEKACCYSPNLHIKKLDLADQNTISQFAEELLAKENNIDVLINNAGAVLVGPPDAAKPEEIEDLFRINVFGTLRITQLFIPQMRQQMRGHILTIGSTAGIETCSFLGIYSATKFALEAIVGSWATTLHKWNIKVSIVAAGGMNTNLPNNLRVGSYYANMPEDPYKRFNQDARDFLKMCLTAGKDPRVIAESLLEIIREPDPHFRYQTCEYSSGLAAKHLRDPKGNEWVQEHRQLVDPWLI